MGRNAKIRKMRKQTEPVQTLDGRRVVSRSVVRYIRCSPRKVAYVVDTIRNKTVEDALDVLKFLHRPSAVPFVTRALLSAAANAQNIAPEPNELIIGEVFVETAPMIKRVQPASMGRAFPVRKRMTHLTINLTEA